VPLRNASGTGGAGLAAEVAVKRFIQGLVVFLVASGPACGGRSQLLDSGGVAGTAGGAGAEALDERCRTRDQMLDQGCGSQIVTPGDVFYPLCNIPITVAEIPNPAQVYVFIDCQSFPMCDASTTNGHSACWRYDNPVRLTAIVLSAPLCADLQEHGFRRIDVVYGCSPSIE
jgi:hypothetical protein